jgi:hypothetical protein
MAKVVERDPPQKQGDEEDVSSYWITLRKREGTGD